MVWSLHRCLEAVPTEHAGELESAILADCGYTNGQDGWVFSIADASEPSNLVRRKAVKVHLSPEWDPDGDVPASDGSTVSTSGKLRAA